MAASPMSIARFVNGSSDEINVNAEIPDIIDEVVDIEIPDKPDDKVIILSRTRRTRRDADKELLEQAKLYMKWK